MSDRERLVDRQLAEFLESGLSLFVSTRNGDLIPDCACAGGLRAQGDGRHITIFLPAATCEASIRNLEDNGDIAIVASRPRDYRTIQLKGKALQVAPAAENDRGFVTRYRDALAAEFETVGIPRRISMALNFWPSMAITVAVTEVYDQTPGPKAGAPLVSP